MPEADTIFHDTTAIPLPFYSVNEPYELPEAAEANVGIPLDSIFRPCDTQDTVYRRSLFTNHKLVPQHNTLQERPPQDTPAWVFGIIVLLCGLTCIYYRNHKLKLADLLKGTFESGSPDKTIRGLIHGIALLLTVLLLSSALGMTIWFMALRSTGIVGYLLLVLAITAAYMLRNGLLSSLADVFNQKQAMNSYIIGNYAYHLLLATAIIPLLFALVYVPGIANVMAIIIGSLTALVFLIRLVRGIKLFLTNSKSFSLFLFYYLCIVEIVPFLIALKVFIAQ